MYHSTIKQYFGGIRDTIKGLEGFFEFVVIIVSQGLNPRLDFLRMHIRQQGFLCSHCHNTDLLQRHSRCLKASISALSAVLAHAQL